MAEKPPSIQKSLLTSLLNQIVSSGTNFLLGLYLIRNLPIDQYGLYGISFAGILLFAGLGNALILTQMVVRTPEIPEIQRNAFAARFLCATLIFCAVGICAVNTAFAASTIFFQDITNYSTLVAITSIAAGMYQTREFFIRNAYNNGQVIEALRINGAVCFATGALFSFDHLFFSKLGIIESVLLFALSQAAGALIGFLYSKPSFSSIRIGELIQDVRQNWHGGRWATGGVVVTWLQSQAHIYLTAIIVGPTAVGQANAARMLLAPFQFIVPAINQVTMPRLASLRVHNMGAMIANGTKYTKFVVVAGAIYVALVQITQSTLVTHILGEKYIGLNELVVGWSIVLIFQLIRDGASTLMQGMKQFKMLTKHSTISSVISIALGSLGCLKFGVIGAILGTAIGEALLAGTLWLRLKHYDKFEH